MPENAIRIDRHTPGTRLDQLVTQKASEVLNAMPDASGRRDRRVSRYERSGGRKAYRASHYERSLTAKAGRLGLKVPKLKGAPFASAVIERGLEGVRLVVGDRCAGLVSTVDSMLPKARCQRCMARFMRNVLSKTPPSHREWASAALKAMFAMESRESALDKAETVAAEMEARRLNAGRELPAGENPGAYLLDEFPDGHRRRIRTSNMVERLNREIRRRKRVTGGFPDGDSALMLICTRICYVTANEWSTCRYLDMSRFDGNLVEAN